jgi:hypothetical protein
MTDGTARLPSDLPRNRPQIQPLPRGSRVNGSRFARDLSRPLKGPAALGVLENLRSSLSILEVDASNPLPVQRRRLRPGPSSHER